MHDFLYQRPTQLPEASQWAKEHVDYKLLAGGMSLIPSLKMRLSQPAGLIDLSAIDALKGVRLEGDELIIKAMTPHAEVAIDKNVRQGIRALCELAAGIGDPLVRNRGTIGGSLANADPAACYPSAVLALNATIKTNQREIAADQFFLGLFETALHPGEIITEIRFPKPKAAAYWKFRQPASRFSLVGVFVAQTTTGVRVAITGAADTVFRHTEAEQRLNVQFHPSALKGLFMSEKNMNSDIHASAQYRAHCIDVITERAVAMALNLPPQKES